MALLTGAALALGGCAGSQKRPVFYPNDHLESVGRAQAQADIDTCMALAEQNGVARNRDGEVGSSAAKGAALGGIASGVWGLVRGEDDAAERAAAGAAAGAATGATSGAFRSAELNPTFKRFVGRCLGERGYDVIGWE